MGAGARANIALAAIAANNKVDRFMTLSPSYKGRRSQFGQLGLVLELRPVRSGVNDGDDRRVDSQPLAIRFS